MTISAATRVLDFLSDKNVGILAVTIGAGMLALTLAGVYTLGFMGSFVFTAGAIIWYRGVDRERAQQKIETSLAAVEDYETQIDDLLSRGASLDAIAADFHARHRVPAETMLLVLTLRLRAWLDDGTPEQRAMAERIVSSQRRHASPTPPEALQRLHEPGVGIYLDDTAIASEHPPSLSPGPRGTLVLTPYYLFFVPMTSEEANRQEFSTGVLAFDVIPMAAEAFSIVRKGYRNPFAEKDARTLRTRFDRKGSFALPIGRITALRLTTAFVPALCLDLEWRDERGDTHRRWINTTLREESSDDEPQPQTWAQRWIHRLRLIGLAEGNDIPAPASITTARFALPRGHGHFLPPTPPPSPAQRRRALKTIGVSAVVLLGSWALAFVMLENDNNWGLGVFFSSLVLFIIIPIYRMIESPSERQHIRTFMGASAAMFASVAAFAVYMVENGNNWGIGLFVLGFIVSCAVVFLGFRSAARAEAAKHPRDPTVLELLESSGGLARLAHIPRAPFALPVEHVRMDAVAVLLMEAQSGDPARRQKADRMATNQAGGPLAAPADSLRAFLLGGLYFPGEAAVRDPSSTPVAGAIFAGAQYLFFLAGATAPPGTNFDPETTARLETALSHSQSLAIPARDVREIELNEEGEPTMRLTVEQAGATNVLEFRVGESRRPEVGAARAGYWMTRIQFVSATEGNLLRWEEDRPRLTRQPA